MKPMKEDKNDVFDEFSDRELLLNYRRNLEKAKQLANSANSRSQDAARDVRNMEQALVNYLDKIESATKKIDKFINLPWYKKLFYKGDKATIETKK